MNTERCSVMQKPIWDCRLGYSASRHLYWAYFQFSASWLVDENAKFTQERTADGNRKWSLGQRSICLEDLDKKAFNRYRHRSHDYSAADLYHASIYAYLEYFAANFQSTAPKPSAQLSKRLYLSFLSFSLDCWWTGYHNLFFFQI